MPVNLARVRQCLQNFDIRTLFIQELGWDRHSGGLSAAVDGRPFALQHIAEKRGFQVIECPAAGDGITYDEFYGGRSNSLIDEIDGILAKHYSFTDEELDFILNYDIKYRMGQDAEGDEEQ